IGVVAATISTSSSERPIYIPIGDKQKFSPPPRDMEALNKLDLRGKTDENWRDYHKEYIDI
ncbi:hypothetical protein Goklo_020411, partial [Gossypium klotzschianum]|nr:hypothetical protein [Gossypium klotzschianum]